MLYILYCIVQSWLRSCLWTGNLWNRVAKLGEVEVQTPGVALNLIEIECTTWKVRCWWQLRQDAACTFIIVYFMSIIDDIFHVINSQSCGRWMVKIIPNGSCKWHWENPHLFSEFSFWVAFCSRQVMWLCLGSEKRKRKRFKRITFTATWKRQPIWWDDGVGVFSSGATARNRKIGLVYNL